MKTRKLIELSTICFAFYLSLATQAVAQGKMQDQTDQKGEGNSKMPAHGKMMDKGMMGKMDEKHMMDMMKQCTGQNKDGKMCDQQVMQKCETHMDSQECMKMMNESKKKIEATKDEK